MKIYCILTDLGYDGEILEYCCTNIEKAESAIQQYNNTKQVWEAKRIIQEVDLQ